MRLFTTRPASLTALLFLAASLFAPQIVRAESAPPRVVATIKPVHALTAAVMDGVARPDLLLKNAAASPHGFALRPSDARKLESADLIVWIGPQMEGFLVRPLKSTRTPALALIKTPGLRLLETMEDGHDNDDDRGHETEGAGEDAGIDPHIWLAPANARAMTDAIAAELARLDPAHAEAYRTNAERFSKRLDDLERLIRAELAPHTQTPFAVYHDGYGYLIDAFGLTSVGYMTISPDRLAGAGHTRDLRATLAAENVRCLFAEPGIDPKRARALTDGLGVTISELDPLGATLPPGPGLYEEMMAGMARALATCLGAPPPGG